MKRYAPALLIGYSFLIALFLSLTLYFYNERNSKINEYKALKVQHLSHQYELAVASHIKLVKALYNLLINKEAILRPFSQAYNNSKQNQAAIRQKIHDKLVDDYNLLKSTIGLRQLHFHLPNNHSFLRMHRPKKFGDDLTNIRESVRLANLKKQFIQGFEEGKIFNGFRYVFALNYEDKHIGTVELSISFTAIKMLLDTVFPSHYDFILKQNVVSQKVFEEEQSNYSKDKTYLGYVRESFDDPYENKSEYEIKTLQSIKENIKETFAKQSRTSDSFSTPFYCNTNQKNCIATFMSIKNLKDQHVAYLISFEQDNAIYQIEQEYKFKLISLSVLFFIILLLTYTLFISKKGKENAKKASTDFLTSALNRFGCQDNIEKLINTYKEQNMTSSLIMLDIDHFKSINDTYGHNIGDKVLKELTQTISKNIRQSDKICRWGGEEFLILLPSVDYKKCELIAYKLLHSIRENDFSHIPSLTVSIGFTQVKSGDTIDSLVKRADKGLYISKNSGRDSVTGIQN